MKSLLCTLFSIVLSIGLSFSQTINKEKLDSLFNVLSEKNKAMGSIAISKNGKILYSKAIGYGFISDSEKIASTINTEYRIGSISKMFTATIIFQLVDEGKINLTTTLNSYFPSLPNAKKITIENLLDHRSGLHDFTQDPDYEEWMTQPKTHDEMLALIAKGKSDFKPDKKSMYCNSNYVILGYIAEKICNKPYKDILKERIISRINLQHTYCGDKTDIKKNESYSYQLGNGWEQEPSTDMSIPGGAGSIVSTPSDLTQFIEALFSNKLISQNSLTEMKTIKGEYGRGIYKRQYGEKKGLGHGGAIDGFNSSLIYFEDSLTLAYCSNGTVYPLKDIINGTLNIYFNKPYSIPTFKTITLTTEDLNKYVGLYSCKKIPITLTISKNNNILMAQAKGQSAFPLDATEKDKFEHLQTGIILQFDPEKNELTMKQGGQTFLFTKTERNPN